MLTEYIKDQIVEQTKEFDMKKGYVTCEFAIYKKDIPEFKIFLKENNIISQLGKWCISICKTCQEDNNDINYCHCEIVSLDYIQRKIEEEIVIYIQN